MYPGYGDGGVGLEGYTGYPPDTLPGPVFKVIPEISPTYGQMKAISGYFMRFSQIGSNKGPRLTSE